MNCADARARLPALIYGDLPAGEADELRKHLADCPGCRSEYAAFAEVRGLLDVVPAPAVTVDLPRLYRAVAEQQGRRLRLWRRVAYASLAAAAAVVAGLLLSRVEVRLDANQVVLRWGAVPAPPESPPPAPLPRPAPAPTERAVATAEVEQELRLLTELAQELSNGADRRDDRQRREMIVLRAQIQALQQQLTELRLATEKDVSALYAAQLPDKKKGAPE